MKYSTAIAATLAVANAVPVEQVCKIVTSVVYGQPTWVPDSVADPTWAVWSSSKPVESTKKTTTAEYTWSEWDPSKTAVPTSKKTTTTEQWSEWYDPSKPKTTTKKTTETESWSAWTSSSKKADPTSKTTEAGWESWTASSTKKGAEVSTTTKNGGEFYPVSTTTTYVYTTGYTTASTTAAATTTTSTTAAPAPTCGSVKETKFGVSAGSCTYDLYCRQAVNQAKIQAMFQTGSIKFWEADDNKTQHNSAAECEAICDNFAECNAVIYVDDASANANDYKRCWMVDNLPAVDSDGYGQISYKKSCS